MIDAILTNTVLPAVSRELLIRLKDGQPIEKVHLGVADDGFAYEFRVRPHGVGAHARGRSRRNGRAAAAADAAVSLSIGRMPDNDWVLPDPERLLSKHHCLIEQRRRVHGHRPRQHATAPGVERRGSCQLRDAARRPVAAGDQLSSAPTVAAPRHSTGGERRAVRAARSLVRRQPPVQPAAPSALERRPSLAGHLLGGLVVDPTEPDPRLHPAAADADDDPLDGLLRRAPRTDLRPALAAARRRDRRGVAPAVSSRQLRAAAGRRSSAAAGRGAASRGDRLSTRSWRVPACDADDRGAGRRPEMMRAAGSRLLRHGGRPASSCWSCGPCSSDHAGMERTMIAAIGQQSPEATAIGEARRCARCCRRAGQGYLAPLSADRRRDRRSEGFTSWRCSRRCRQRVDALLRPFDPADLEQRARRRLALEHPASGRAQGAKFWELFNERYRIAREADRVRFCATSAVDFASGL